VIVADVYDTRLDRWTTRALAHKLPPTKVAVVIRRV